MGSHTSPICSTLSLSLPIMFPGWVPKSNTVSILEGSISSFWAYAAGFSAVLASRGINAERRRRTRTNKQTKKERNSGRGNVNNQNGGKDDVSIYCPVAREKKRKTEKNKNKGETQDNNIPYFHFGRCKCVFLLLSCYTILPFLFHTNTYIHPVSGVSVSAPSEK